MVSIVTGNGLGLFNSSRDVLGAAGEFGQAASGRAGERVTVNAANGNVVVQARDEYLSGVGPDVDLLRTYNSKGGWDGDNGDGWRIGYYRRVFGFDPNAGVVKRTEADGHETTFSWNAAAGKYTTPEGAGSFDSLSFDSAAQTWAWTDGDTGMTETYATVDGGVNYRLTQVTDTEQHAVKVRYDGAGLIWKLETWKAGASAAYETNTLNYGAGRQLASVATSYHDAATGADRTRTLTRYDYNSTSGKLEKVTTDLTPEDTADDKVYSVIYGYDASGRLQTITQADGSQQRIDYDSDGRVQAVADQTVTAYWPDGGVKTTVLNRQTTFGYDTANRITYVMPALGQTTALKYGSGPEEGLLLEVSGAALGGAFKQSYTYLNGDLLTSTNGKGETTRYTSTSFGTLQRSVDAAGNVVERSYNSLNLLESETVYSIADPDGAGRLQASGPRKTWYLYQSAGGHGQLQYVVNPDGTVAAQFGRVVLRRGFGNHTALASKWQTVLVEQAFTPCLQYAYAPGKNTSDIALAIDAIEALFDRRATTFCLVTSDSDFAGLCRKLRERGATVHVIGEAKTHEALRNASDQFFQWVPQDAALPADATPQMAKAPAPQKHKMRPKSVVSAVKLMAAESADGRVSVSALGSYLRRTDPSFSPQLHGHSGLVSMLKTYDLLDLRLEPGGHWSVALAAQHGDAAGTAAGGA